MGNPNVVDILHMEVTQNLPYWLSPEVRDAGAKAKIRAFVQAKRAKPKTAEDKMHVRWVESDHPRGQPGNAGEFGPGGGGGSSPVRRGGGSPSGEQQPTKVSFPSGSAAFVSEKQARELGETLKAALAAPAEHQPDGSEQPIKASLPNGGIEYMTREQAATLHKALADAMTDKAVEFVSPNTGHLDFDNAVKELDGERQRQIADVSHAVNDALGIPAHDIKSVVGAWADGAENTLMEEMPADDMKRVEVAAAMKGYIADQKQVLVFKPAESGNGFMANFEAHGALSDIHQWLGSHGLEYHTLEPLKDGAIVHIYGTDNATTKAVAEAGKHYQSAIEMMIGEGEFLGTQKQDGSEDEQRADARKVYEGVIGGSGLQGVAAKWQSLRDRYAPARAVKAADERVAVAEDMKPWDWRGLIAGVLKFFMEEMDEPEHAEPMAAGVAIFCRPDLDGTPMRVLLVRRSPDEKNYAGYWSLPGGGIDKGETPEQAARREASEEIGWIPGDLKVLDETDKFITFCTFVDDEFDPMLNSEHTDHMWSPLDDLPKPIHPGVLATLEGTNRKVADDSLPVVFAMDRSIVEAQYRDTFPVMANDFESARSLDVDGKMHVSMTHISKACVSPYLGSEIPDCLKLGLDPKKVYHLLRDPEELAKGAATSNRMQVLIKHEPVNAQDFKPSITVGATGSDAVFNAPYLDNSMVIWSQKAIEKVLDGDQEELSSSYRYTPDMTPGVYEGVPYDGVMRGIVFNHVALVKKGRAGPDVVVADEAMVQQQETEMPEAVKLSRIAARTQTALTVFLMPKLAKDAALDLTPYLKDITPQNFKARKADIWKGAKDAATPLLNPAAKAAGPGGHGPDDIAMRLLDMIEGQSAADPVPDLAPAAVAAPAAAAASPAPAAAATDPNAAVPAKPDDKNKKVMDALRKKGMSEDDISEIGGMLGSEPSEDAAPDKKPDMVTKSAMDEAIAAAVAKTQAGNKAKGEAIEIARGYVGNISPMAYDTAEDVLRATLGTLGVDHKELPVEALKPLLLKLPKPGSTTTAPTTLAMDAKAAEGYAARFPQAGRLAHA